MYGHIRHGLPILGGAGAILGGNDGDDEGDHLHIGGHGLGGHGDPGDGGSIGGGFTGHGGGGFGGPTGHGAGGHAFGGGVAHGLPSGPHGALPFTGFDSLKLALLALVLVVGGLLLMRMVMLISKDN